MPNCFIPAYMDLFQDPLTVHPQMADFQNGCSPRVFLWALVMGPFDSGGVCPTGPNFVSRLGAQTKGSEENPWTVGFSFCLGLWQALLPDKAS